MTKIIALSKIISIIFVFIPVSCCSQQSKSQIRLSENFINSVLRNKMTTDDVIEKFILVDKTSERKIKFAHQQIQYLREEIEKRNVTESKLKYFSYAKSGYSDLLISESEAQYVVIIRNGDERFATILLQEGKIKSFTTMNKGGKRIFITF